MRPHLLTLAILLLASPAFAANCTLEKTFDDSGLNGTVTIKFDHAVNLTSCGDLDVDFSVENASTFFDLAVAISAKPNLVDLNVCAPPQTIGLMEDAICLEGTYVEGTRGQLNYNGVKVLDNQPYCGNLSITVEQKVEDEVLANLNTAIGEMLSYRDQYDVLVNENGIWQGKYGALVDDYMKQNQSLYHVQQERDSRPNGFWQVVWAFWWAFFGVMLHVFLLYLRGRAPDSNPEGEP